MPLRITLITLIFCLCAACGGPKISSIEPGADSPTGRAAWHGSQKEMLADIENVLNQYGSAEPADPPVVGLYAVNYGKFKVLVELTPIHKPSGGNDDTPPLDNPVAVYGLNVEYEKGLDSYRYIMERIYADVAAMLDSKYDRVTAP